jgi:hypothetical protein
MLQLAITLSKESRYIVPLIHCNDVPQREQAGGGEKGKKREVLRKNVDDMRLNSALLYTSYCYLNHANVPIKMSCR